MSLEQALMAVWRQVMVEDAGTVTLNDAATLREAFPLGREKKSFQSISYQPYSGEVSAADRRRQSTAGVEGG